MENLDLLQLFKGFIRNHSVILYGLDNTSTSTHRVINFWMRLGEMMGYFTQLEQQLLINGKACKADLLWIGDDYETPVLHLESENYMSGTTLITTRLDPTIPYLVAIFRRQREEDKAIIEAALYLMKCSDRIRQLLVVIWGENEGTNETEIPVKGIRFTRTKDHPDIIEGWLSSRDNHPSGPYTGILEQDWDDTLENE